MAVRRRTVLSAGLLGLTGSLSGCAPLRPGIGAVNDAIEEAPGVLESDVYIGPGGGLGEDFSGDVTLEVAGDQVRPTFEEAWRRGVEVIHRMEDGERGRGVRGVNAIGADGTEVFAEELVDLPDGAFPTIGDYYDLYGIG